MNLKKMLEVAGVEEHLNKEKTVFAKAQTALSDLHTFLTHQEGSEYSALTKQCLGLREALEKHLKRYE